jgi:hypothetical protein
MQLAYFCYIRKCFSIKPDCYPELPSQGRPGADSGEQPTEKPGVIRPFFYGIKGGIIA